MKRIPSVFLYIFAQMALMVSPKASADPIVYTSDWNYFQFVAANDLTYSNIWNGIGQSFKAQDQNVKIGFAMSSFASSPVAATLSLYQGDGVFGTPLATRNISVPSSGGRGFVEADFSSVNLSKNSTYTVVASLPNMAYPAAGSYSPIYVGMSNISNTSSSYADGRFYFTGSSYNQSLPFFAEKDLGFIVTPVSTTPSQAKPSTFGLFVGVEDANPVISMNGASMATQVYQSFKRQGNQAELLTAHLESANPLGNKISYWQIQNELANIKAKMKPGDEFVFYLNSHGGGGINKGQEFLRLGESLTDAELYQLLYEFDPTGIYRKSVFIDACHAGGYWTLDPYELAQNNLSKLSNISFYGASPEDEYMYFEFHLDGGLGYYSQAIEFAFDHNLNQTMGAAEFGKYLSDKTIELINGWHTQHPVFYEGDFGDEVPIDLALVNPVFMASSDFNITQPLTSNNVPEPKTLALVLSALCAIIFIRRSAKRFQIRDNSL